MILLFTKSPEHGRVKTRLQPHIGAQKCLKLHAWLIRRAVAALRQSGLLFSLYVDGSDSKVRSLFEDGLEGVPIYPQIGADLGERMHNAILQSAQAHSEVIVVGSDCVEMDADQLVDAFHKLRSHEVVIAPAVDGGYTLIGANSIAAARAEFRELFANIEWGTEKVFQQTQCRIDLHNFGLSAMPTTRDLDTYEDLRAFSKFEPELRELL